MPKLTRTSTVGMSRQDWLDHRMTGLGGSDISSVMGMNPYKSNIRLFHEKVGTIDPLNVMNFDIYRGQIKEDIIAKYYWPYYDPDGDDSIMLKNIHEKKVIRKCRNVFAYVQNEKYPWLFSSIDRMINRGQMTVDGKELKENGILEIKNPRSISVSTEEKKQHFVELYMFQVQSYLGVYELDYGELFMEADGFCEAFPIRYHDGLFQEIVKRTGEFWERVTAARALMSDFELGKATQADLKELNDLEPEPDASADYAAYLKEQTYKESSMKGDDFMYDDFSAYKTILHNEKQLQKEKQQQYNTCIKYFKDNECDVIDFGDRKTVTFRENKRGTRTLRTQSLIIDNE